MWVVKLGGSLLGSPELPRWLDTLVKVSDGKVVIVPGGGIFADAVREAQKLAHVSDATAHHLALCAMDQFGLLLAGMNPSLVTASTELELAERGWQHRAVVWLPSHMALADETIPENWDVTSDSLSAWVARKVGASHVVLVKSKDLSLYSKSSQAALAQLVTDEVIDSAFEQFYLEQDFQTLVVNKADYSVLQQGLSLHQLYELGVKVSRNA